MFPVKRSVGMIIADFWNGNTGAWMIISSCMQRRACSGKNTKINMTVDWDCIFNF